MNEKTNGQSSVVRTERGLSVAGTRITLYQIMDYLHAGWPPKLVRDWLNLTEAQMAGVLAYLDAHREAVEKEYQVVVQTAEENRRYWEERNRERFAAIAAASTTPEKAALRAKLEAWKKKLEQS